MPVNLPAPFRNWLDCHFTRCERLADPEDQDPPEVSPYRGRISESTPLLSLRDLENLPCGKSHTCPKIEKYIRDKIIGEAVLELLRENGGTMSKDELYEKLCVDADEELQ